jgi:Sulfotransferase domain
MEELLAPGVLRWQVIVAGRKMNWDEVFAGYHSQVDWPGAHIWQDLATAYPQAKVIHTVRLEEHWWRSFSRTICADANLRSTDSSTPHIVALTQLATEMICAQTFGGSLTDKVRFPSCERCLAAIPICWGTD